MSSIVESKDGYGWSGGTASATENGLILNNDSAAIVKTIYIDEQKIAPTYIFWQVRLYNTSDSSVADFSVATNGLLTDYTIASSATYPAPDSIATSGSTLITIEGFAVSDVTITIAIDTAIPIFIYPNSETGA